MLDTRDRADGSVKRRRLCPAGHRFSTAEEEARPEVADEDIDQSFDFGPGDDTTPGAA